MSAELARLAAEATRIGAAVLLRRFRDRSLVPETKAENDLVSVADRESEAAIVAFLSERLPEHQILSEEAGILGPERAEYQWIVDPLDGTSNYLQGLPIWGISVACKRGREIVAGAILDPLGENLFVAAQGEGAHWNGNPMHVTDQPGLKGAFLATGYPFRAKGALDVYLQIFGAAFLQARSIRRCGAACLDLAYTAAGVYDGFFEFRLSAWDLAAGVVLIREAGGAVSDLSGGEAFLESGNLIAGGSRVQAALLALVGQYASESRLHELAPLEAPAR